MLNWALLKHPYNWAIVTLMAVIAFMAINIIVGPHIVSQDGSGVSGNSIFNPNPALSQ